MGCLCSHHYSMVIKTPSPASVPARPGPPRAFVSLSKALTGLGGWGPQEEKGAAAYKAPGPWPWRLVCQNASYSHSQDALLRGWHGPGWEGVPRVQPWMDPPWPHPMATSASFPGLLRAPSPSEFAHAWLQVARSRMGVGGCGLPPGQAKDPGRGAGAQGQSPPVIKSSAGRHHAHGAAN